jgi:hypothetical protein
MSQRLEDIQRRKHLLISRAAAQRSELAYLTQTVLNKRLLFIEDVLGVLRAFRVHPVLAGVAISSVLLSPIHRVFLWAGRIYVGWEVYQAIREQWPRRRLR